VLSYNDFVAAHPDLPYENFVQMLSGSVSQWKDKTAILYRAEGNKEFKRWSYIKLGEECRRLAHGLSAAGLVKGERVCLWAENRPEWMAVWLASAIAGLVIVPVDFLAGEAECANIIKITGARALFHSEKKQHFADSLEERGISVPVRVSLTGSEAYTVFGKSDSPLETLAIDIDKNDPVSIVFTSGTTGFAKGVTLSHKGILANMNAAACSLRPHDTDVFINVLPLHHTYPTMCSFLAPIAYGCPIIVVEKLLGSVVVDDIRDAGGTFLIAVPLLYDKVMAAINKKYQALPVPLKAVLNVFRAISLAEAKRGRPEFGQTFFRFIRKKAGLASIRIMVAGGGPLNPKTADFFDSFGFNIVHGYGMSENSPLVSVNTPWHKRNVSVGHPVKYTEVTVLDPDESGTGELVIKSPSVMLGYYGDPKASAEVIMPDGRLRTGDLGFLDKDGFIYINGRSKNLIVSSGGKKVYPEEIEAHFIDSKPIREILIMGRKEKKFGGETVFAVIVPDYEYIAEQYPDKKGNEIFVRSLLKKEIMQVNQSLSGYKKIADFTVRIEPFEKNAQQKIRRFLYKSYETNSD